MKRILTLLLLAVLASCARHEKPLVGISCALPEDGATHLSSAYPEAIVKAGGIPVVIPLVASPDEAEAVVGQLDGIIFSGGEDVNTAWYGEEIWNETVEINHPRDRSDSLLARAALASGKPVMGICRGEQLLNVLLGGSLWQDIPSQIPSAAGHHGGGVMHRIGVEAGSILSALFGEDSLTVNSYHHQAVKDPAPGLRITARSAEGVVEAYENAQVIGVQFHPEKLIQAGQTQWISLFAAFLDRCRE